MVKSVLVDTPEYALEDGYIINRKMFCDRLKTCIQREKFHTNKVIFTVSSTKIYTKEITVPVAGQRKLKEIIHTNIKEYLPFDISDYTITYSVIEKVTVKEKKMLRVFLYAAPENLVTNYYNVAEMLGLEVESLDYMGNSMYQILKKTSQDGTNLYMQVNETSTMISILKGRSLMLQRTISYGTNALAEALLESDVQIAVTSEREVDKLMQQTSMMQENPVREAMDYLSNSIERVISYYVNQDGGQQINSIFMLGHGTKIRGLRDWISTQLGAPIQEIVRYEKLKCGKYTQAYKDNPFEFAGCIGAVYHSIGIQSKKLLEKKEEKSNTISTAVVSGVCLLFSILFVYMGLHDYQKAEDKLKQKQSQLFELPLTKDEQGIYSELLLHITDIEALEQATKTKNEHLSELMNALEKTLPTQTKVQSLQITNTGISMNVVVPSKEVTAKLMLQLESMNTYFSDVNISGLSDSKDETGIGEVSFVITCQYNGAAAVTEGEDSVTNQTDITAEGGDSE